MNFRGVNIFDLNYEFTSDELGILHTPKENLPKKGILIRILSLFKAVFFFVKNNKKRKRKIPQGSILFFALNDNEKKAFSENLKVNKSHHLIGDDHYINGFPILKIYLISLLFIPIVFFYFLATKDKTKKVSFKYVFDSYCLSFAAILISPSYLNKLNPKKIFISNHTRPFHRIIMRTFRNRGLGYIQHASFIDKMPPFNGFDYLLVDGKDSLNKLINSHSSNNHIYLIGNSKYDNFLNYEKNSKDLKSIGVCVNNLDDLEDIKVLVKNIKENFPLLTIFLRPHPSDPRFMEMSDFSVLNKLNFSNSREVDSIEFLKGIDILLAGDSNIHLESIYLNIPSIYINFLNKSNDWYGFLKEKMLYNGNSPIEIINILTTIKINEINVRELGKYFNASVGTIYQGKSGLLVSEIINDNFDFINNSFIKRVNDNNIYELNE